MITIDDIQKIKESLSCDLLPIGAIVIFAAECPPDGFIVCDGRMIKKNVFQELYAIIGNTFGEDGESFGIPDLRGRFVRGFDMSNLIDPQRSFGDYQDDALQGHSHKTEWNDKTTNANGAHSHSIYGDKRDVSTGNISIKGGYLSSIHEDFKDGNRTSLEGLHSHTLPDIILDDVCSGKYGRVKVGTETRPKNLALNFCIKVK